MSKIVGVTGIGGGIVSNSTDNPSQSPDAAKEYEKAKEEFEEARKKSYKGNEDLKNKMFLGCFGLAAITISIAAVSGNAKLDSMVWGTYAAQTVMVVLFVFGLQALAVTLSIIALKNPTQPLWRWLPCKKKDKNKDKDDIYKSYRRLVSIARCMDMTCLITLAVWNICMAVRIAVTLATS